jgi:hypothetical protein
LSNYIEIKSLDSKYSKEIDGIKYDLVYLGTAGVRNNSSGINKGDLFGRLKWHLNENKSKSALKSGTMSTFRRTIGALIGNDLIENNTQEIIDEFFRNCFIVFYLEYEGEFLEVKDIINAQEEVLIKNIRPIFNLDKNPNAKIENHYTYSIQKRRQTIEKSSIKKNIKTTNSTRNKESKRNIKIDVITTFPVHDCIEFKVKRNQNISEIARNVNDLPNGPCFIKIFSNNTDDIRNYINGQIRNIRVEERRVDEYFDANDTQNGNISRSTIIKAEMNQEGSLIEEITVRVCPLKK